MPIGATVIGRMQDIVGSSTGSAEITFIPLPTPLADGSSATIDVPRTVRAPNGDFSAGPFIGGLYRVDISRYGSQLVMIPLDSGTYTYTYVRNLALSNISLRYNTTVRITSGTDRLICADDGKTYQVVVSIIDGGPVLGLVEVNGGGESFIVLGCGDDGHAYQVQVKIIDGGPILAISPWP